VALARVTDQLRPAGVREPLWQQKWDGWRAVWAGQRLWSRRGTALTRYFPDLARVLGARLPADVVVDGELVCWDPDRGLVDFQGLSRRLTAGRRHPPMSGAAIPGRLALAGGMGPAVR